jgi:hypothetical protein
MTTEELYEAALRKCAMSEYAGQTPAREIAAAALRAAKTTKETNR